MAAPWWVDQLLLQSNGLHWTPQFSQPLFWFDSELSCPASGAVTNAIDAAGGAAILTQSTAGKKPTVDSSVLLNGRRSIRFIAANASEIASSMGGLTGNAAHSIYLIGRADASPVGDFGSFGLLGQKGTLNGVSVIGRTGSGQWWAGGYDGSTEGPVNGSADGHWHFFAKKYDGSKVDLFVDGIHIINQIAYSYNLVNGISLGPYLDGSDISNRILGAVFRSGADPILLQTLHEAWAFNKYKIFTTLFDGDSITSGFNLNPGEDYPSQCAALLPTLGLWYNSGVLGRTMGLDLNPVLDILPGQPDDILSKSAVNDTPARTRNGIPQVVVVDAITFNIALSNNLGEARTSTQTGLTALQTYAAACRAADQKIIALTLLNDDNNVLPSFYSEQHSVANTFILGGEGDWLDGVVQIETVGDISRGGDSFHPDAAGNAVIAARVAAKIKSVMGVP